MKRVILPWLCVAACVSAEPVGTSTQAIAAADGEDTVSPFRYPMVVDLDGACTGTLIDATHILTAAHCVQRSIPASVNFASPTSVPDMRIPVLGCAMNPAYTRRVASCIRPEFVGGRSPAEAAEGVGDRCGVLESIRNTDCFGPATNDLAVLQLARPIPLPGAETNSGEGFVRVVPAMLSLGDSGRRGEVVAVGFGIVDSAGSGAGTRRWRSLGERQFRNPIDLGDSERIIGSGDSDGPLLTMAGGELELVAVAHSGFRPGTGVGAVGDAIWTGIDETNRSWIDSVRDRDGDGRFDLACPGGNGGVDPDANALSDQDGDGTVDAEDSCPGVYNPCQRTSDRDGDGVADDCDACPLLASLSLLRGDPSLEDDDLDGLPNLCDCRPEVFEDAFTQDPDDDLVLEACDNCPELANSDQADNDDDTLGDRCDACPFDEDELFSGVPLDADGDGVPKACDNCPGPGVENQNPLQANCNLDAELEVPGVEPRGDICDPTPCADTTLGVETRNGIIDGRPARVVRMDALYVDAIAAEPIDASAGFRFCRCPVATADDRLSRVACFGDVGGLGECAIGDIDGYNSLDEERKPWRRDVVDFRDTPTFTVPGSVEPILRREAALSYEPPEATFSPELNVQWNTEADTQRWATIAEEEQALVVAGLLDPDLRRFPNEEDDFSPLDAFFGILWTHTPRTTIENGDGSFSAGPNLDEDTRALASHYWSGGVAPQVEARAPFPCLNYIGALVQQGACLRCNGVFPRPFFAVGGERIGGGCAPVPQPPLLAMPDLAVDLRDSLAFDPGLIFQDPSLRWLTPAEPVEWLSEPGGALRVGASSIRLVALDSSTSQLVHVFEQGPGGLTPRGQISSCDVPGQCDPFPFRIAGTAGSAEGGSADSADSAAADSADGGTLVLSARREILWEIRDEGRITRRSLAASPGRQSEVELYAPAVQGKVLAATYRPDDDSLYVLTQVRVRRSLSRHRRARPWNRGQSQVRLRLVRVDASPTSDDGARIAESEVVGDWPRLSWNTDYALAPASDGTLWVVASGSRGRGSRRHIVARLERGRLESWHLTGASAGRGRITEVPLVADRRGLSLVVIWQGEQEAIGYRNEDLSFGRSVRARDCF